MPRSRPQSAAEDVFADPRIDEIVPPSALPLGEVELLGAHLGPHLGPHAAGPPVVLVGTHPAHVTDEPARAHLPSACPTDATSGLVEVRSPEGVSNAAPLNVARELDQRTASGDEPRGEPVRHDLRHHLWPARKADAGLGGAREP